MHQNTLTHSKNIGNIFDILAPSYNERYETDSWCAAFHKQRLNLSLSYLNPDQYYNICDIGAGTGQLYHTLCQHKYNFDYFGVDLSQEMKKISKVPDSIYLVSNYEALDECYANYDAIFLLGVTTYLTQEQISSLSTFLSKRLNYGGYIFISFTNKESWDFKIRSSTKKKYSHLIPNKYLLKSNKTPFAMSYHGTVRLFENNFEIVDTHFMHHSLPLVQQLLPKISKIVMEGSDTLNPRISKFAPDYLLVARKM